VIDLQTVFNEPSTEKKTPNPLQDIADSIAIVQSSFVPEKKKKRKLSEDDGSGRPHKKIVK
jgi:hypothetical protein